MELLSFPPGRDLTGTGRRSYNVLNVVFLSTCKCVSSELQSELYIFLCQQNRKTDEQTRGNSAISIKKKKKNKQKSDSSGQIKDTTHI